MTVEKLVAALHAIARKFTLAEEDNRLLRAENERLKRRVLRSDRPEGWDQVTLCTFTLKEVEEMGWLSPGRTKALRDLVAEGKPWPPERGYMAELLNEHLLSSDCWCGPNTERVS